MPNSRRKGADFERRVAHLFQEWGYPARRSAQYCGKNGDHDVLGVPGLAIECKAVERLDLYGAMEQAKRDAKDGEVPVVIHKKNNKPILVTMGWEQWREFYSEWESGHECKESGRASD